MNNDKLQVIEKYIDIHNFCKVTYIMTHKILQQQKLYSKMKWI